jgi:chromosomal replication initiator protein
MLEKSSPPELASENLWTACQEVLAKELPSSQFQTWISPLRASPCSETKTITLIVGNRFKMDWIRSQYGRLIQQTLESIAQHPIYLTLSLGTDSPKPSQNDITNQKEINQEIDNTKNKKKVHTQLHRDLPSQNQNNSNNQNYSKNPDDWDKNEKEENSSHLASHLTFDNLVEGTANRMARTAAMHILSEKKSKYNPFFIYGGVGLGKTHLMHAIGNQFLNTKSNAKVLYIHAEQFVSDVVKSYQKRTFEQFKKKYHHLDVLLIDDVQFFSNKERTQEEFFNAFEALLSKKSQIVLTSDTYPKGLADISERLVSRFDSGLTVGIDPPELEMRVAILIKKAQIEEIFLDEEVAFFVAKHVRSNVRELEGALRKILAYAKFNQKKISVSVAKEALRDLLSIQNQQISIDNIQKTVCDYFKIKMVDMLSSKKQQNIVRPRQIAMYLSKELTTKSLPEIGELFGGRDHTTVLYAVKKIALERQNIQESNQKIHVLEQILKG